MLTYKFASLRVYIFIHIYLFLRVYLFININKVRFLVQKPRRVSYLLTFQPGRTTAVRGAAVSRHQGAPN